MKVLDSLQKLRQFQDEIGQMSLGFVPTMGALHEGHVSLVRMSLAHSDKTLVSIYVNPTQFNNPEDLAKYPSTLDTDLAALEAAGCDAVFLPNADILYPEGLKSRSFDFGLLGCAMEGAGRPGHFEGMATVVTKFFELVQPTHAYFGEKDWQQLSIVQHVVREENWPVEIIPGPIVREASGLAMSSRNERLSTTQREEATAIYAELMRSAKEAQPGGETSRWIAQCTERINAVPSLEVEYIAVCDIQTLQPVSSFNPEIPSRIFAAVQCGNVRLIDNIPLF